LDPSIDLVGPNISLAKFLGLVVGGGVGNGLMVATTGTGGGTPVGKGVGCTVGVGITGAIGS